MLKAHAWPYPVAESIEFELEGAIFKDRPLETRVTSNGIIINGKSLKNVSNGKILLTVKIKTARAEVAEFVFGKKRGEMVKMGFRVLCEGSKFRGFFESDEEKATVLEIPLERVKGVICITPLFFSSEATTAVNGIAISRGAVVGTSLQPIFITIDEDWAGDEIPVFWKPFDLLPGVPVDAILHIHLGPGSDLPEVWLNERFKHKFEPVITRDGNSPAGFAGGAMRELIWIQVWEKVFIWAFEKESDEDVNWPSTRIAKFWREKFIRNGWKIPTIEELDSGMMDEISVRIQHCLTSGERISRVAEIFQFGLSSEVN